MCVPWGSLGFSPEHNLKVASELVILPELLDEVRLPVLGVEEEHGPHQAVVSHVHALLDRGRMTRLQIRQGQAGAPLMITP